jgi:hypothetical protein
MVKAKLCIIMQLSQTTDQPLHNPTQTLVMVTVNALFRRKIAELGKFSEAGRHFGFYTLYFIRSLCIHGSQELCREIHGYAWIRSISIRWHVTKTFPS